MPAHSIISFITQACNVKLRGRELNILRELNFYMYIRKWAQCHIRACRKKKIVTRYDHRHVTELLQQCHVFLFQWQKHLWSFNHIRRKHYLTIVLDMSYYTKYQSRHDRSACAEINSNRKSLIGIAILLAAILALVISGQVMTLTRSETGSDSWETVQSGTQRSCRGLVHDFTEYCCQFRRIMTNRMYSSTALQKTTT